LRHSWVSKLNNLGAFLPWDFSLLRPFISSLIKQIGWRCFATCTQIILTNIDLQTSHRKCLLYCRSSRELQNWAQRPKELKFSKRNVSKLSPTWNFPMTCKETALSAGYNGESNVGWTPFQLWVTDIFSKDNSFLLLF
jgi:hypothetical protein